MTAGMSVVPPRVNPSSPPCLRMPPQVAMIDGMNDRCYAVSGTVLSREDFSLSVSDTSTRRALLSVSAEAVFTIQTTGFDDVDDLADTLDTVFDSTDTLISAMAGYAEDYGVWPSSFVKSMPTLLHSSDRPPDPAPRLHNRLLGVLRHGHQRRQGDDDSDRRADIAI